MRRTIILLTLAACLALAGCSSSYDEPSAKVTETVTATAAPAATPSLDPSLSQAEIASQCTNAIAEAAPSWEDWNYSPGGWQDDPRTPTVCQGLADEDNPPAGNRAYMQALIVGLEMADDPRARQ
ncbi:hypothetical protein [Streptomyces sp. E5N298]|uniref:hypothetical protein n=1 Tax=Streptomyces sp. E5N298 TaxID=1851983 RepID=UPI000EF62666|nr:hypothetical protein [Streptomyces sp. E5N298]